VASRQRLTLRAAVRKASTARLAYASAAKDVALGAWGISNGPRVDPVEYDDIVLAMNPLHPSSSAVG